MEKKLLRTKDDDQFAMYIYDDLQEIKGIVQIVHGKSEHLGRYQEFAQFLNSQSYLVIGVDLLGHGLTADLDWMQANGANKVGKKGYIGKLGYQIIYQAIEDVFTYARDVYDNDNYILFGHSMGSFIVKDFLRVSKVQLNKVVLSGTGYNKYEAKLGLTVCKVIKLFKRDEEISKLLIKLIDEPLNKRFKSEGENAWLSTNAESNKRFIEDPLTKITFTINAYEQMFKAIDNFFKAENIMSTKTILSISGKDDPVGEYSKAIGKNKKHFEDKLNIKFEEIIYESMRHEVLNEINKEKVYQDILKYITKRS